MDVQVKFERPNVVYDKVDVRFKKYQRLFSITDDELINYFRNFVRDATSAVVEPNSSKGLQYYDTFILSSSKGNERGTFYIITFDSSGLEVSKVHLKGRRQYSLKNHVFSIEEFNERLPYSNGIKDAQVTATEFFDCIAMFVREFMIECGDLNLDSETAEERAFSCGVSFGFALEKYDLETGTLIDWSKGFETGRATNDPVERSADITEFLIAAFERKQIPLEISTLTNDTPSVLMSSNYCNDSKSPRCTIGVSLSDGINLCYVERASKRHGYTGFVLVTECGSYTAFKRNIIDLQIDCFDSNKGKQLAEKMIAGLYIPELCRRTLLRIFRADSPELLWSFGVLTLEACCAVAYDESPNFEQAQQMTAIMLDKKITDLESLKIIRDIFRVVLTRSAKLFSVIIAGYASMSGKLQPAVGGVTIGICGELFANHPEYQAEVKRNLVTLLGPVISNLVHFHVQPNATTIGTAVLVANAQSLGSFRSYSFF